MSYTSYHLFPLLQRFCFPTYSTFFTVTHFQRFSTFRHISSFPPSCAFYFFQQASGRRLSWRATNSPIRILSGKKIGQNQNYNSTHSSVFAIAKTDEWAIIIIYKTKFAVLKKSPLCRVDITGFMDITFFPVRLSTKGTLTRLSGLRCVSSEGDPAVAGRMSPAACWLNLCR